MTKVGESMIRGAEQALAFARGEADPSTFRIHYPVDVKAIRERMKLTQEEFANQFGFSVGAVRDWEQGRRTPTKAARILLRIIDKEPKAVKRALAA